jgi:hypothetical protein
MQAKLPYKAVSSLQQRIFIPISLQVKVISKGEPEADKLWLTGVTVFIVVLCAGKTPLFTFSSDILNSSV